MVTNNFLMKNNFTQLGHKKVLLFCPKFFNYEKEIIKELENFGAIVDYFDERPKNNFITKAAIRINKKLIKKRIKTYYNNIYEQIKNNNYDYVFVVNIEAMLPEFLEKIKNNFFESYFILYMWDSIRNKKYTKDLMIYFDRVLSFDKNDALSLSNVHFRPLFFIDKYANIKSSETNLEYDLSFIGTVHSDRFFLVSTIKNELEKMRRNIYFYMYFPSKILFYRKKLSDKKFSLAKIKDFSFTPMSQDEIIEIVQKSKSVLDIQHPSQTGLTMRTLEMLGAEKKLITTNKDIVNYDFYHPENILVIDRENPIINSSFLDISYNKVDEKIKHKYSIKGWLEEIFILGNLL